MIEPDHPALSIGRQCRLLSISRSSLYYSPLGETNANLALMRLIDKQFLDTPFYGVRQMTWHLRNEGHPVNEKRIRRLMRLMPIYQAPNTSTPAKGHKTYPYLLRGLRVDRPNQVWCADITYIPMRKGFLYLVAIMDWHTRKVLAWRISNIEPRSAIGPRTMARGGGCLRRGAERGDPPFWAAGHHEHRSGIPVHVLRLDRPAETGGHPNIRGRQGTLHRQRLHRKAVEVPEA
jgi:putative transposase